MSDIATALAKAKERPATQAPFMVPGVTVPASPPPKKRAPANLVWMIVLAVAMSSAGVLLWWQQSYEKPSEPNSTSGLDESLMQAYPHASGGTGGTTTDPKVVPQLSSSAMQERITRNEVAVRLLNISAVIPGEKPRIMSNGRIYQIGEIVIAPEISFSGTNEGQLIFTDAYGNRYTRRF